MDVVDNWFSHLFDSVSVALCAVDRDGTILHINRALAQMLGWNPAEREGQPLAPYLRDAILDPAHALSWTIALSEAVALGKTTHLSAPTRFCTDSGKDELHNITGMVVAVTQDADMEAGAVVAIYGPKALASTAGMRVRRLSAMSHELGLPMSNIAAAAELLANTLDSLDGRQGRLVGIVQDEVARLQRLVAQFLSDPPTIEKHLAPARDIVALRPILRRVSQVSGLLGNEHDITVQVPPDLPFVWGDTAAIQQVLSNLADSVLHRSSGSTSLHLGVEATPDEVRIWIADPGAEVSCEGQPAAFHPRPQGSELDADCHPEGLGLAVSRSLVEAMGGRLWYRESSAGQRCFCFTLPRADGRPQGHQVGET